MTCLELRDIKLENAIEKYSYMKRKTGVNHKIVVISLGEDPASKVYIKHKRIMAEKVGLGFEEVREEHVDIYTINDTRKLILELNKNEEVAGIILQLPLPTEYRNQERMLLDSIAEEKDIDRLSSKAKFQWMTEWNSLLPATAKGVYDLLVENDYMEDYRIAIVGRSDLVGLPLFFAVNRDFNYLNTFAELFHRDSKAGALEEAMRNAHVVISATGNPNAIDIDDLKEGGMGVR